jgi:HEPN domain-containing protein
MSDRSKEWLKQADYDMGTAEILFDNVRYLYAVFMSHLSIEKALKGLYSHKTGSVPPKIHNLLALLKKMEVEPPPVIGRFLTSLNETNIVTRYPEDLDNLRKEYDKEATRRIIDKSREALAWIKTML